MRAYEDELDAHVLAFFQGHAPAERRWKSEKVARLNPLFHVLELGPGPRLPAWTYVTSGAGRQAPDNGRRLEFVLCAREPSERHVQLLYMTAHYHLTGETLDVGHTFSIGEPWVPGSSLDCVMVSLPFPFGPALEVFEHGDHQAHLLWLTPISSAERAFARRTGVNDLEALLESEQVDFLDPDRQSVVGRN